MADSSKIEWTDATWNPVTGCSRVSPGCDNCYMHTLWPRLHGMGVPGYEGDADVPALQQHRLQEPLRWRKPRRVFVCSMSDLFHPGVPFAYVERVFRVMKWSPRHTFQVLTKRPGRMLAFARSREHWRWPDNVWAGTSLEMMQDGRKDYSARLGLLAEVPAKIRFVSAEPLLGSLALGLDSAEPPDISWVIVGGESGPGARPMDLDWARSIRDQCVRHKVPFFLKQLGGVRDKRAGDEAVLDGRTWREFPA